jgi:hypothetical protein
MAEAEKKEVEQEEPDFVIEGEETEEVELKVEDDTPEEDRNRSPMPKEIVEDLEKDELDNYSDGVKERFKQMKKVWHDERRAKEAAQREHQQAIEMAKKIQLRSLLNTKLKWLNEPIKTRMNQVIQTLLLKLKLNFLKQVTKNNRLKIIDFLDKRKKIV